MKKWIIDRPYVFTSIIFLIVMIFGWRFLYWQEENFAFLLLLYFIVTLGIRLDDISRKIGGGAVQLPHSSGGKDTIVRQLNDIRVSLMALNTTLSKILKEMERHGLKVNTWTSGDEVRYHLIENMGDEKKENKINPMIGASGVSAVPDSARVVQHEGLKADSTNHLLMHAMACNSSGVIGSAICAGILWSFNVG